MSEVANALKLIKDEEVEYVDIRFTDPKGKLQHVTLVADLVDEDFFEEGFMFDGSSIAGWKSIDQSDMKLIPDAASVYIDPFYAEKTHVRALQRGRARHRRGLQPLPAPDRAEGRGLPQVLGHRRRGLLRPRSRVLHLRRRPLLGHAPQGGLRDRRRSCGLEHRHRVPKAATTATAPAHKGGYFPVNPIDEAQDIRGEMLSTMKRMGIKVDKHHHEVATCQHELGMIFGGLVEQADNIQKYKYVIHNVAHAYGKTVTFMPKPMKGDNGSGMHVNMSIWKGGKPLFAGDKYADLSPGGAVFHRRHPEARQGAERAHQPGDQQLQAPDPRLRGPGSARLFGPQPVGLRPYSVDRNRRRPSASRPASPIRRRTPTSPSRRC